MRTRQFGSFSGRGVAKTARRSTQGARSPELIAIAIVLLATSGCRDSGPKADPTPLLTAPALATASPSPPPVATTIGVDSRVTARTEAVSALATSEAAFFSCVQAPSACDLNSLLDHFYVAEERVQIENTVNVLRRENAVTKSPGPDKDYYVVESVELNDGMDHAVISVCKVDGRIVVLPQRGPNGADVVLNDSLVSLRERTEMQKDRTTGQWRVARFTVPSKQNGLGLCPPHP